MQDFIYHNPTKVIFGKGSVAKLASVLPRNKRILLAYGGGSIKNNGMYQQVIEQLADFDWCEFSGIEANPEFATLMKAVEKVKTEKIDYILAVGGGSVIDGCKFIAAAAEFEGDPWDILAKGGRVNNAVSIGCILTLPATGSETNTSAVVNHTPLGKKLAFMSDFVRPDFAVLDPEVTYSLPNRQLANGVVDAFVHVVEQYMTYPVNASVQDRFAESIMQNLIDIGPDVFEKENYDTRANLMWNASQALNGLIGVGVPQDWSTHMIGHELTALYGLDHAVTLAIVLPQLLRHQKARKRDKLLQFATRVWALDVTDEDKAIDEAINLTENFFRKMGILTKLSEHGIENSAIKLVPEKLSENGMVKIGEHQDITPVEVGKIIAAAM